VDGRWLVASADVELEDRLTVASAEGIDLDLSLAGISSRAAAFLTDLIIESLALFLVFAVGSSFGDLGVAFSAIAFFMIFFGYPTLAETFAGGRTLGKALFKIHAVSIDGGPLTFLSAAIRNIVRVIDALPGVYLVGLISIVATKKNQRVGDLAANTLVIHKVRPTVPGRAGAWDLPAFAAVDTSNWDVTSVTAEEVAAVRSFLMRRGQLDPSSRANLAQTLAFQLLPKVAGVPLEGGPEVFLERVVTAKSQR